MEFFFSERQTEQLKNTNVILNRVNLTAHSALRRVRWSNLTQNQYREEGLAFGTIANRLLSVLKFRQEILRVARRKKPDLIELEHYRICGDCDPPPRKTENDRSTVPAPDPGDLLVLDNLVESCFEMSERVWCRVVPPRILPVAFFAGLKRLTDALLKERRHFQDTAPNPPSPTIEVVMGDDICGVCHKPSTNRFKK
jgi:hypothetical protein